jgi:hypothetical protein
MMSREVHRVSFITFQPMVKLLNIEQNFHQKINLNQNLKKL